MQATFLYDRRSIALRLPDDATVYESRFDPPAARAERLVQNAIDRPIGALPLSQAVRSRRDGDVVIVVSDITRPVPYASFLGTVLQTIEQAGVAKEQVLILIATGMHRPSTPEERIHMLGAAIASRYHIEDHDATAADLVELPAKTWSGSTVRLNRRFVQAGFRILTGLVEPHFMAGFSGGRKAICPGLAGPETIRHFHGYHTMADPRACNGNLEGNPCHLESISVARQAEADFTLNVVLDNQRRVVRAFAGALEPAHAAACAFAKSCTCPNVGQPADLVITSSGGYPLDATFYQCIKGFVSALPAVKPNGQIIALGACREGIGSREYAHTMLRYQGRWRQFLTDIAASDQVVKDQWQFQMHCRALAKLGQENLHFFTAGLPGETLAKLGVVPHAVSEDSLAVEIQHFVDQAVAADKSIAVLPEGPYCAPVENSGVPGR